MSLKIYQDFQARQEALASMVDVAQTNDERKDYGKTIFESVGEGGESAYVLSRRAVEKYRKYYGEEPTVGQLSMASAAIKNVLENHILPSHGDLITEETNSSNIPVRNIFLGMILPTVLTAITTRLTTPFPAEPDKAEIYRLWLKADSNWRGFTKGDLIDETFAGDYGNMDVIESLGTGNGVLTTFAKTLGYNLRKGRVKILIDKDVIAKDDENGAIAGTYNGAVAITGTVNYDTGAISITAGSALPNGLTVDAFVDADIEANSELIPKLRYDITKQEIFPHESVLAAQYSVQAMLNMQRNYNQSLASLSSRHLLNVMTSNIDRVIIDRMYQFALGSKNWDSTIPVGLSAEQYFPNILLTLDEISTELLVRTKKVGLFGVIGGDKFVRVCKSMSRVGLFDLAPEYRDYPQPHFVGRLGSIEIYKDPRIPSDEAVCVAKGQDYFQAGFYSSIAIPFMPFRHSVQEDLRYKQTLYGKQYREMQDRNYFMKLKITGTGV